MHRHSINQLTQVFSKLLLDHCLQNPILVLQGTKWFESGYVGVEILKNS